MLLQRVFGGGGDGDMRIGWEEKRGRFRFHLFDGVVVLVLFCFFIITFCRSFFIAMLWVGGLFLLFILHHWWLYCVVSCGALARLSDFGLSLAGAERWRFRIPCQSGLAETYCAY